MHLLMHGRYVTDILKTCMKKFNAEKIFLTNLKGFDLHIAGDILSLACNQFLVVLLLCINPIFLVLWPVKIN